MSINIGYGMDIQSLNDPVIITVEKAMEAIAIAGNPGSFFVDNFPLCVFLFLILIFLFTLEF